MTRTLQRRILLGLALPFAGIVAANVSMVALNRATQADVNSRGQYIQQSIQLNGLYNEIVKALADLSARNQDAQLKDLLAKHGITFTVNAPPPPPAPTPAPAAMSSTPAATVGGPPKDNKPQKETK